MTEAEMQEVASRLHKIKDLMPIRLTPKEI